MHTRHMRPSTQRCQSNPRGKEANQSLRGPLVWQRTSLSRWSLRRPSGSSSLASNRWTISTNGTSSYLKEKSLYFRHPKPSNSSLLTSYILHLSRLSSSRVSQSKWFLGNTRERSVKSLNKLIPIKTCHKKVTSMKMTPFLIKHNNSSCRSHQG